MAYQGKCALVTGGAQGIGLAVVEMILRKGGSVAILDISPRDKFQWPTFDDKTQKLEYIQCDVSDRQQLIDSFKKAQEILGGQLDIVVNNAGILNEVNWVKMMEVALIAVIRGTYLGINLMSKEQGGRGGVIINTASTAGIVNRPILTYGAAKTGVRAFSCNFKMIPNFYKDHGIRINCVCPGFTNTEMPRRGTIPAATAVCDASQDLPPLSLATKMNDLFTSIFDKLQESNSILSPAQIAEMYEEIIDNESLHGEVIVFPNEAKNWRVYQQSQ